MEQFMDVMLLNHGDKDIRATLKGANQWDLTNDATKTHLFQVPSDATGDDEQYRGCWRYIISQPISEVKIVFGAMLKHFAKNFGKMPIDAIQDKFLCSTQLTTPLQETLGIAMLKAAQLNLKRLTDIVLLLPNHTLFTNAAQLHRNIRFIRKAFDKVGIVLDIIATHGPTNAVAFQPPYPWLLDAATLSRKCDVFVGYLLAVKEDTLAFVPKYLHEATNNLPSLEQNDVFYKDWLQLCNYEGIQTRPAIQKPLEQFPIWAPDALIHREWLPCEKAMPLADKQELQELHCRANANRCYFQRQLVPKGILPDLTAKRLLPRSMPVLLPSNMGYSNAPANVP
jgi:hypothetical protein